MKIGDFEIDRKTQTATHTSGAIVYFEGLEPGSLRRLQPVNVKGEDLFGSSMFDLLYSAIRAANVAMDKSR